MSSIMFHTDLDPSGLERGIKSSKKSIDVWITESIIRIDKLQDEVDKLGKLIEKTPAGQGVSKLIEQWKIKTSELNTETEKLNYLQEEQAKTSSWRKTLRKALSPHLLNGVRNWVL